jgi:transposase
VIGVPGNIRVYLACGVTDMRKGFDGLAARVERMLQLDPHSGALFVFRGRRGDLLKVLWWDGQGLCLFAKRLERGRFLWPQAKDGSVVLTPAQLSMLLEGIDWERRETDERQRVQVPYDEGVANHIGPESCAGGREAEREALTGVRVGQPLSGVRLPIRSANALQSAEGNTTRRVIASAGRLRVVVRPWHARTSLAREPRDLRFAPAGRAVGRTVKAGGRRP